MTAERRNWAGNHRYRARSLHLPRSVEELQELVLGSREIKALGTRHSFNAIADSAGAQISIERLNRIVGLDAKRGTVTLEGDARFRGWQRQSRDRGGDARALQGRRLARDALA